MKFAEKYLKLIISTLLLGFLFFINSSIASAYGVATHEYLTNEAAVLYNNQSENKVTPNELIYLNSGARKEDDFPRFFSHFYDPVYNRGLSEDDRIDKWNRLVGFIFPNIKSKDWAEKDSLQKNAMTQVIALGGDSVTKFATVSSGLSEGDKRKLDDFDKTVDFTWRRAITLYNSGDKEKAFYALGHVLHLIEDSSVPDHTRNDPHPDGSPYELFSDYYSIATPDSNLKTEAQNIVHLNSLSDYFDSLARYSNNNFYSVDTTSGVVYENPKKIKALQEGDFIYDLASDGAGRFHKIMAYKIYDWSVEKPIIEPIWSEILLSDYWSHLAPRAVEHASGVIDLFFKEAAKAKLDPNFIPDTDGLYDSGAKAKSVFSTVASVVSSLLGLNSSDNVIGTISSDNHETNIIPTTKIFPSITLSKKSTYQPDPVLISGNNFTPQSRVIIKISGDIIKVEYTINSDSVGGISFSLPTNSLAPGKYSISAEDVSRIISNEGTLTIKPPKIPTPPKNTPSTPSSLSSSAKKSSAASVTDETVSPKKDQPDPDPLKTKTACLVTDEKNGGQREIIFNEIAWMGRVGDPLAEWIELKNISDYDVDISNWSLVDKNRQINILLPENSKIKSGALYLLERDSDNTVPEAAADLIYKGSLGNTNESLKLLNKNCEIVDEIASTSRWPAGEATFKHTAERDKSLTWRDSLVVNGTPKKENSVIGYQYSYFGGSSSSSSNNSSDKKDDPPPPSLCKILDAEKSTKEILLNEISWSGASGHPTKEWIELYNPTSSDINLSNWQLQNKDGKAAVFFKEGDIIKTKAFYLLERGATDFIPDIVADKFFTGSINNSDEAIYLFDNDCKVVDEVADSGDSWKNVAGSASPDYRTAERQKDKSWGTYLGDGQNGVMGTPKAINSEKPSESSKASDHLVISEVWNGYHDLPDEGFIEFYNPTDQEIDLSDYALKIKDANSSEALFEENSPALFGKTIKPKGFFLIGGPGYNSFSNKDSDTGFISSKSFYAGSLELYDGGALIDEVTLKTVPLGSSLERMAISGSDCVSPSSDGEFLGNGCSDGSILETRTVPNPQNSLSLIEPRARPALNFSESDISLTFDFNTLSTVLSWDKDLGLIEIDNGEKTSVSKNDSKEITERIYEVGKDFSYNLKTIDIDGLESADKITKNISIPRFNDLAFFRSNIRDLSNYNETRPVASIGFDKFPFVPANLVFNGPPTPNYKGLVFYLNSDARSDEFLSGLAPNPEATNVSNICYNSQAGGFSCQPILWLPDITIADTWVDGGPNSLSLKIDPYLKDGDKRVALPLSGEFSPSDYFTVSYYGFYAGNDGSHNFKLLAVDNTKNYFSNELLNNNPPTTPQNINLTYSPDDDYLVIKFDPSTDSDGPDSLISYELSFDGLEWKATVPNDRKLLPSGNDFSIRFRAIDNLGVSSDVSTSEFHKP